MNVVFGERSLNTNGYKIKGGSNMETTQPHSQSHPQSHSHMSILECKLFDFHVNEKDQFQIQMFGIDQNRNTYSITVNDFNPFIYIRVGNRWTQNDCDLFIDHLKSHPDIGHQAKNIII